MIVINTGVPKSGTTLVQQYQIDLVNLNNSLNGINEIMKYGYNIDKYSNVNNKGFFGKIDQSTYNLFVKINVEFGDFVAKTHSLPNEYIHSLVKNGIAKVTCCYRDPRDIILSTIDHAKRTRDGKDKTGAYIDVYNIEDGIIRIKRWFSIFEEWFNSRSALMIKYEDLLDDKIVMLRIISNYLELNISQENLKSIYEKHERIKQNAWNFNIGTKYRWKDEMDIKEIKKCNQHLAKEILSMGYEL